MHWTWHYKTTLELYQIKTTRQKQEYSRGKQLYNNSKGILKPQSKNKSNCAYGYIFFKNPSLQVDAKCGSCKTIDADKYSVLLYPILIECGPNANFTFCHVMPFQFIIISLSSRAFPRLFFFKRNVLCIFLK